MTEVITSLQNGPGGAHGDYEATPLIRGVTRTRNALRVKSARLAAEDLGIDFVSTLMSSASERGQFVAEAMMAPLRIRFACSLCVSVCVLCVLCVLCVCVCVCLGVSVCLCFVYRFVCVKSFKPFCCRDDCNMCSNVDVGDWGFNFVVKPQKRFEVHMQNVEVTLDVNGVLYSPGRFYTALGVTDVSVKFVRQKS